jgi:hypothetical protein
MNGEDEVEVFGIGGIFSPISKDVIGVTTNKNWNALRNWESVDNFEIIIGVVCICGEENDEHHAYIALVKKSFLVSLIDDEKIFNKDEGNNILSQLINIDKNFIRWEKVTTNTNHQKDSEYYDIFKVDDDHHNNNERDIETFLVQFHNILFGEDTNNQFNKSPLQYCLSLLENNAMIGAFNHNEQQLTSFPESGCKDSAQSGCLFYLTPYIIGFLTI